MDQDQRTSTDRIDKENDQYMRRMLRTERAQLKQLHTIVEEAMTEETSLAHKLAEEQAGEDTRTSGERIADKVASFGGSWTFIIGFGVVMTIWIMLNVVVLATRAFDPYPFILLNLVLSCLAALQAPIIMMSQNRQEAKDRKRGENDYLINLRAELEIRSLHRKVDLSIEDQFKHLCDLQQKQLEWLERIEKRMDAMSK